jgi:OmpA-OmpF porin, OOP family
LKIKLMTVAVGIAVLSSAAMAEVYVGVAGGVTHSNATDRLKQTFVYDSVSSHDKTDIGSSVYVGYAFNPTWAIQAAYFDLGRYDIKGTYNGYSNGDSLKANAYAVSGVGSWPLGHDISLDGRVGVGSINQKYHCLDACYGWSDTSKKSYIGVFGIGAHWAATSLLTLRVGYDHLGGGKYRVQNNITNTSGTKTVDYGLLSFGVEAHF